MAIIEYAQTAASTEEDNAWRFVEPHQLHVDLGDGRHLITLSGTVLLGKGGVGPGGYVGVSPDEWRRDRLQLTLDIPYGADLPWHEPGKWLLLYQFTPFVTINAIYNAGESNNAGWAVDQFGLFKIGNMGWHVKNRLGLWADLAVRDSDGTIYRVAYSLTALGRVENWEG